MTTPEGGAAPPRWIVPNFLKAWVILPIIGSFVGVGILIIFEATRNPFVLENIVALILALTVLTIPADKIIVRIFTTDNPDWLRAGVAIPIVLSFVGLASFIIYQATRVEFVLEGIVALMAALGIFSGPTYKIVEAILGKEDREP